MDAQRFDLLARGFAHSGWTRRGLARLLTGVALAPVLGRSAPEAAAKKKRGKRKKQCNNGAVKCGNACVDLQTDPDHCGGCNNPPCANNETCQGGQCVATGCGPNQRTCGNGVCIPDDIDHCCDINDCGGSDQPPQGITCNTGTHRCVCKIAGHGICQRFSNKTGLCGPCCPGATVDPPCAGDQVCLSPTLNGCGCPNGTQNCPFHHSVCVANPGNDPRCCALGPAENFGPCLEGQGCWCGLCRRGCQPSPQGGQGCTATPGLQCGSQCTECPQDEPYCCETGPGEAACSSDRYCGG